MLASREDVASRAEAVVVATPTASHAELARFFLERDLDVLVEKPMTASLAEADALVALARSRGRILEVGHVERYNPAVEAALSRLASPIFIEGHRLAAPTERSLDIDVVLDLMIHDLQIVDALVRRPVREVRAAGMPVLTGRVDIANARIEFEGGCVANLTASRVSTEPMRKLRVFAPPLYCSIDMHARSVAAHRLVRDGVPAGCRPGADRGRPRRIRSAARSRISRTRCGTGGIPSSRARSAGTLWRWRSGSGKRSSGIAPARRAGCERSGARSGSSGAAASTTCRRSRI